MAVVQAVGFFRPDMGFRQPTQGFFLCFGVQRTDNAKGMKTHAVCTGKSIAYNTGLNQCSYREPEMIVEYWMRRTEWKSEAPNEGITPEQALRAGLGDSRSHLPWLE